MNKPTMDSTPGRSAGRPETVVPKTTSRCPLYRDSSSAQAPWITVFSGQAVPPGELAQPARLPVRQRGRTVADDCTRCASTGGRS